MIYRKSETSGYEAMNGILKELGVQLLPNTKIKQLIEMTMIHVFIK